jgi:hypothetical protein
MILLNEEEIAVSSTKGFEECEVPLFRPPSLSREIKLRQKAGDKAVAKAQARKIVDEAKRRGVFSVDSDGLVDYVSEDITGMRFWSELIKEIEG